LPRIEPPAVALGPMVQRIPFPQPFGPPPTGSVTCNYMTTEEVREFMLNEQKVCHERLIFLLIFVYYLLASIVIS
jgi:hypothetical protein